MGNAALSARSAAQGLGHLATVWATITAALGEQLAAFQKAKDAKALKAVGDQREVVVGLWKKLEALAAVNDDTF